jgi:hypothetical protein
MATRNPYEGMTRSQLLQQCDEVGVQPGRGETEEQLAQRLADYDATISQGRRVSRFGLTSARRRV